MNAIIQPIHLILYSVFIGSAIDLAVSNPLYAIVAMAFLTSAEKFVKQMFGLDKAKTPAGLAAMAGGALAMKGIGNVVGKLSGKGGSSNKLATSGAGDDASKLLSRGKTPGVSMDSMATLAAGTGEQVLQLEVQQVLRQVLHQEPLLEALQEKSMINRLIMEMKQVEINKIIKILNKMVELIILLVEVNN